jgi:8-oxo-dGTP diphosphatase
VGAPASGRTRLAAYALVRDELGRVLLCRASAGLSVAGQWFLPGGGVGFGESPEGAVLRELAEETGLVGEVASIAGIDSHVRREPESGQTHAVSVIFHVRIVGGELRDEIGGSTDHCAWLDPPAIARLPVSRVVRAALRLGSETR